MCLEDSRQQCASWINLNVSVSSHSSGVKLSVQKDQGKEALVLLGQPTRHKVPSPEGQKLPLYRQHLMLLTVSSQVFSAIKYELLLVMRSHLKCQLDILLQPLMSKLKDERCRSS